MNPLELELTEAYMAWADDRQRLRVARRRILALDRLRKTERADATKLAGQFLQRYKALVEFYLSEQVHTPKEITEIHEAAMEFYKQRIRQKVGALGT